jgi:hypothetical protein
MIRPGIEPTSLIGSRSRTELHQRAASPFSMPGNCIASVNGWSCKASLTLGGSHGLSGGLTTGAAVPFRGVGGFVRSVSVSFADG